MPEVTFKCQNQFLYYIKFTYRKAYEKNILARVSCLWFISRPPKSGCFFGKFTAELVLKSFSGRNNSLMSPVFGFRDSLPFGLEESREVRALIRWVWGNRCSKMSKLSTENVFFVFEMPLWIY